MSEPIHQDDDLHGAHSGDAAHASNPDEAAPAAAAHADPAATLMRRMGATPRGRRSDRSTGRPGAPVLLGVAAGLAVACCLFISTST